MAVENAPYGCLDASIRLREVWRDYLGRLDDFANRAVSGGKGNNRFSSDGNPGRAESG